MSDLIRKYNQNFTWFILVGEGLDKVSRGGSHSFRGYTDHAGALGKAGAYIQYVTSTDDKGRPVGKYFTFDESRRRFQVRDGEQDVNKVTQYDFLKNSPDCEGSPNGTYTNVEGISIQQGIMFREFDKEKDAAAALKGDLRRIEALSSASRLDSATLQELGAGIGVFGEPNDYMRTQVIQWAEKRPGDYFRLLEAGDRAVRAIVRKALADGIFETKGTVIHWGNTVIGSDEEAAIATLLKDKQMLAALQTKADLGTAVVAPPKKQVNKGGRPPKIKTETKGDKSAETKTEQQL